MKQKLFGFLRTDRRGLALISVLGVVTLATILILALFAVSDSEFKASRVYSDGASARRLADSAVAIVMGQVQAAATGAGTPGVTASGSAALGATIWASQPGACRIYDSGGNFILGRSLYSTAHMVWTAPGAAGEQQMTENVPPATWAAKSDQWVDLNKPVERQVAGANKLAYYPIFDPRAIKDNIDGFQILGSTTGQGGVSSKDLGYVAANSVDDVAARLPMPVEWLYILQDGTVGTVSQSGNTPAQWVAVGGAASPSDENPIVGRVGFWTDDECCKININTAGEPGYYDTPVVLHDRDMKWADSPPALFEYQRYPGHPATVALSSVFSNIPAPGFDPSNYYPTGINTTNLAFKNAIYSFVPKLAPGGTQDGTLPFAPDDFASASTPDMETLKTQILAAKSRPLFASVDEILFTNTASGISKENPRLPRTLTSPTGTQVITPARLERARAFLTARSRAPETNMFGLPRVAIWPVPDTTPPPGGTDYTQYRTGYDSAVAICAKLGQTTATPLTETQNSYYFSRRDSTSALTDMGKNSSGGGASGGVGRNASLMNYLDNLVHMNMPGGSSFAAKYNNGDAEQILVEIFDYIRCTNLYDGFLSEKYPDETRDDSAQVSLKLHLDWSGAKINESILWDQAPNRSKYFTYTAPRFTVIRNANTDEGLSTATATAKTQYNQAPEHVKTGAYPGHGQVKPIEWNKDGKTFRGFGRFPTISEVALHFICTADGKTDDGSYMIKTGPKVTYSGGKTSERIDPRVFNSRVSLHSKDQYGNDANLHYYSNIPPYPNAALFETWGCVMQKATLGGPQDPANHPGADASQWNCTLDYNASTRSGVALAEDEKRIQICLLLETFIPSVGYTKYVPDYTLVLNPTQMAGIKVQNAQGDYKSVFSTSDTSLVVQSTYAFQGDTRGLTAGHDVSPLGGSFAPSAMTTGRQVASVGKMPKDPSYNDKAGGSIHGNLLNFPLVSNFLTVKRADSSGKAAAIKFKVEQPLEVDIYGSHDWQGTLDPANKEPSQRVNIKFPTGEQSTPVPHLVVYSTEAREYTDLNGTNYKYQAFPCVRWWAFNYGGAINRYVGKASFAGGVVNWNSAVPVVENQPQDNMKYTYGRFHSTNVSAVRTQDPFNRNYVPGATGNNGAAVTGGGLIYGYSPVSNYSGQLSDPTQDFANIDVFVPPGKVGNMGQYKFYGTDSVRSIIPRHGDYRMLAARKVVDAGVWDKHPVWQNRPDALFAHSLSGSYSDAVVGFDLGGATDVALDAKYRLVPNCWYESNNGTDPDNRTGRLPVIPDTPLSASASAASNRYRDWDNGIGNLRDGAYINKPDDGNLSVMKFWHAHTQYDKSSSQAGFYVIRNTYFTSSFLQLPSKSAFFTPNRIISSPGMFGSLPTGVWGSLASFASADTAKHADTDGVPFRTLLFRADVDGHVGAPKWSQGAQGAPGPADHYFMDLFFMPIVEPYAITDSYSTAGKINLNYQIVPFTHIRRTTAMWAAMKGEMITAISSQTTDPKKGKGAKPGPSNTVIYKKIKDVNPIPPDLWNESGTADSSADNIYWHHSIDVEETLRQMDERFAFTSVPQEVGNEGLMLTASQVCELHLIPKLTGPPVPNEPTVTGLDKASRKTTMAAYWAHNDLTGDNTRERPYANLYQKFTTRSNTFRVYFTAQTLHKARSLQAGEVDTRRDTITAEYRGSALFERYLDFSSAGSTKLALHDYGAATSLTGMPTLEDSYHYRVLELKQFAP